MVDHIKLVSLQSDRNKMTPAALAAVFGPLFTCNAEEINLHRAIDVFKFLLEIWPAKRSGKWTLARCVTNR